MDKFIKSDAKEREVIILDCDDTDAKVYENQQLAIFNNYYGDYCIMPLHIYEGILDIPVMHSQLLKSNPFLFD